MKDKTKKVVILNNFSSPYISEAIIVLKDYNPQLESKVIADAEKIVSDYIKKSGQASLAPARSKKSGVFKFFIATAIIMLIAAILYCITFLM